MPENYEVFQPMKNLKGFEQMVDIYGVPCDVHLVRTFKDGQWMGVGYDLGRPTTFFVYDAEQDPRAGNGRWHKHCGPYSTFDQAKDWIDGIREDRKVAACATCNGSGSLPDMTCCRVCGGGGKVLR